MLEKILNGDPEAIADLVWIAGVLVALVWLFISNRKKKNKKDPHH